MVPTSEINGKNSVCAQSSVAWEMHTLHSFGSRNIHVGEGEGEAAGVGEQWQLSRTIRGHKEKASFTVPMGWLFSMTADKPFFLSPVSEPA